MSRAAIEEFGDYLEEQEGKQVSFYVFNADRDSVRMVSLVLTEAQWGPANQTGLGTATIAPAHCV